MKVRITESKLRNLVYEVIKEELAGTYGVSDHMDTGEEKLEEVDGYGISDHMNNGEDKLSGDVQEGNLSSAKNSFLDFANMVEDTRKYYENTVRDVEDEYCLYGFPWRGVYSLQTLKFSRGCLFIVVRGYGDMSYDLKYRCFTSRAGKTVKYSNEDAEFENLDGGYQGALTALKKIRKACDNARAELAEQDPNLSDEEQNKISRKYKMF